MIKFTEKEKGEIRSEAINSWDDDNQKYAVFMFKGKYYIISTKEDNDTFIVRDLENNVIKGLFY